MTSNALRTEAVWALRRLDNKVAAAAAYGYGNDSGHWDNVVAVPPSP